MEESKRPGRKKLQTVLIVFLAAAFVIGIAVYSKLRYTTFNLPKVIYAKATLDPEDSCKLGDDTYMLEYKESYESTLGRFVEDIGGDTLRKDSPRETPEWLFELDGKTYTVDQLNRVDFFGSYVIINIKKL